MTTIIQIGNTDDKLQQRVWSEFVAAMTLVLCRFSLQMHFSGGSMASAPWQNHCWICEIIDINEFKQELAKLAAIFQQDSIALTVGTTEFITPEKP